VSDSAVEGYLEGVDERFVPMVRTLDAAIRDSGASFDTAIKYRQLTYAVGGDYHRWVCAIDAAGHKRGVALRFLYGWMLDDPRGVFRGAKTSPLRTMDFTAPEEIDTQLVTDYVKEAASKFDAFVQKEREGAVPTSSPRRSGG
jgi:hypothetical protein